MALLDLKHDVYRTLDVAEFVNDKFISDCFSPVFCTLFSRHQRKRKHIVDRLKTPVTAASTDKAGELSATGIVFGS